MQIFRLILPFGFEGHSGCYIYHFVCVNIYSVEDLLFHCQHIEVP